MGKYIPPHLRKAALQSDTGPPVRVIRHGRLRGTQMDIQYAENAINNLYILCPTDKRLQLRVVDTMESVRLRVVSTERSPQAEPLDFDGGSSSTSAGSGMLIHSHQDPRLRSKLEQDLRSSLEELACLCADKGDPQTGRYLRPLMWLRFGRLSFVSDLGYRRHWLHSRLEANIALFLQFEAQCSLAPGRSSPLEAQPPFSGTDLEKEVARGRRAQRWTTKPFKRLDTNLPQHFFDKLKEVASRSTEDKPQIEKESFVIEVRKSNWKEPLLILCKVHGMTLAIWKFKRRVERRHVADLSWATEWDLRLMLATEVVEADDKLSDDERKTAEGTVKMFIVDPDTDLGIRWASPPSWADSGNSDVALKFAKLRKTKIFERGRVWSFMHASRSTQLPALEVDLRLASWKSVFEANKFRKEQIRHSADGLMDSTFDLLSWICSHCL